MEDQEFWINPSNFLYNLITTVESTLILQSGKETLVDVLYTYGRQYQSLLDCHENAVLIKLEKRFNDPEFPLLFLCMFLHPKYQDFTSKIVNSDVIQITDIAMWVCIYAKRWELTYTILHVQ